MMFGVGIGVGFCGDIIGSPTKKPTKTRNAFMRRCGISPTTARLNGLACRNRTAKGRGF